MNVNHVCACIGEFMQLGTKEEEDQRFNEYMRKNYRKTGSLIANSCKAVSAFNQLKLLVFKSDQWLIRKANFLIFRQLEFNSDV